MFNIEIDVAGYFGGGHWKAWVVGNHRMQAHGSTKAEAIGLLVIELANRFNNKFIICLAREARRPVNKTF